MVHKIDSYEVIEIRIINKNKNHKITSTHVLLRLQSLL